jgi:hypothetical protein
MTLGTAKPALAETITYPEVKTASGFSKFVQGVSGFTLFSGWMGNRLLQRELGKHADGRLHSKLKLFSGSDLLHGNVKGVVISGRNVVLDDLLPLSEFRFESETPIFAQTKGHAFLLKPATFKVFAVLSRDDLNRMLQSPKGQKMLTGMTVSMPPFGRQSFDALQPSIDLANGQLVIQSLMNLHGAAPENALPVKISGKITANNARLQLSDLDIAAEGIPDTQEIAQVVEDYFGELVNLEKLKVDRHRVKVQIQQSEIRDQQLHLAASVTVSPDPKLLRKLLPAKPVSSTESQQSTRP